MRWPPSLARLTRRGRGVALAVALSLAVVALAAVPSLWRALKDDGVHDPASPAIGVLQEPSEALSQLPPDGAGNKVNWVQAIDSGAINPRTNILPETKVRIRDDAIIVAKFGSMPAVRFPHRQHTLWLDCSNCHDKLFKAQAGANRFSMQAILEGQQCGLCHGAVAFPLTECLRCHSVPNASLMRRRPP
jgi:c(7)-type cytochrome triheme protein